MTPEPLTHVLLVEDSSDDRLLVRDAIGSAIGPETTTEEAQTLEEAVRALHRGRPDCVLVDLSLPDAEDLEVVETLVGVDPTLCIVVLTGRGSESGAGIDAVRAGAQDYLTKAELTPQSLGRVMRYAAERAAFAARLRRSEQVFERAMASSPIGMALLSTVGTYIDVNPAFATMLGTTCEDLVGTHFVELTHPEDRAFRMEGHRCFLDGTWTEYVGEKRYLRHDGEIVWAFTQVTAVNGEDDALSHLLLQVQDVTARREADESRARLAAVVSHCADPIYSKDLSGTVTSWNPAAERFYGYRAEEVVGRSAELIFPQDGGDELRRNLERVTEGRAVGPYEAQRLCRDGSVVDVSVVVSPIIGDDGVVIGASTIARDIREEKRSREALARSEARYRRLIESVHEGIWVFDRDGRTTLVNQRAVDLLGCPLEELQHRSPWEFVDGPHPRASDVHPGTGEGLCEVRLRRSDGGIRWVLTSCATLGESDEEAGGVIVAMSDITGRKRQEHELEERERRFRAVFNHAQDAMLIADDERRYVDANPAAAQLLGRTVEELLTLRVEDVSAPDLRAATEEAFETFKRVGHSSGEHALVRPNGEQRHVEFAATANVLPGRHLTVLRDVTERHRAERERSELERQLQQSQRIEGIGMLAGGIAHDFNNLLSIILNYGHYARSRTEDPQLDEELGEIVDAAQRAAALTRQLLTFSRRDVVDPEVVDLRAAVRETVGLLRRTLGERITIRTEAGGEPAPIEIDRGQLDQVLLNLALNARDAMPQGGELTFRVTTMSGSAAGGGRDADRSPQVQLSVTDTGLGMAEEVRARAFEPFFSTKSRETGTGLGLATVYGIVTRSGGEIRLRSAPGVGTTVEIAWPASSRATPADASEDTGRSIEIAATALVVEDEASLRRLIARILGDRGYRVIAAPGAEAALGAIAGEEIDVLVTDVVMPGLQGPELAEILRAQIPGLPVLYISGYSDQGVELMQQGQLLEKPFTGEQLLEAVARAVSHAPVGAAR